MVTKQPKLLVRRLVQQGRPVRERDLRFGIEA
jgi:hypothetical protein